MSSLIYTKFIEAPRNSSSKKVIQEEPKLHWDILILKSDSTEITVLLARFSLESGIKHFVYHRYVYYTVLIWKYY